MHHKVPLPGITGSRDLREPPAQAAAPPAPHVGCGNLRHKGVSPCFQHRAANPRVFSKQSFSGHTSPAEVRRAAQPEPDFSQRPCITHCPCGQILLLPWANALYLCSPWLLNKAQKSFGWTQGVSAAPAALGTACRREPRAPSLCWVPLETRRVWALFRNLCKVK